MADFTDIKAEIDANIIPHNNAQLITGEKLNTTLQDMVDVVNEDKADASALATETAARIAADDTKVDKVSGKGLSTNDYTNAEKSKVTNAPANTTAELATKVDKIAGKGLSANDYTDAEKAKVANVPADTDTALAGKVDKVSGKGLSANDYTDAEKAKLGALPTAAALASSLDGKVDKVAGKGLSSEDYTAAEKGKVANIPADTNAELADIEERKANKDGFYESLGAGYAKSLLGNGAATPELIDFRPSGGTKDIATGVATLKTLFGNTVGMNQLVDANTESTTKNGLTLTNNGDGSYTINGTSTAVTNFYLNFEYFIQTEAHKYYSSLYPQAIDGVRINGGSIAFPNVMTNPSITTATAGGNQRLQLNISEGITLNNIKLVPQFIDLTSMFGAGNEPTTLSDPRIKWLQSLGYVGHNAGSLLNYKGNGLKTVGVNQWDEEWELGAYYSNGRKQEISSHFRNVNPIPIVPSTSYSIRTAGKVLFLFWYDADMNLIEGEISAQDTTKNSPANAAFLNFYAFNQTFYNRNIQIALYHSGGDIPTTYHPYEEHILNLPITTLKGKKDGAGESVVIFPDGMKSAGTAKDYLYGNVLGSFTKAKKVMGVVDLGSLDWYKLESSIRDGFYTDTEVLTEIGAAFNASNAARQVNSKGYPSVAQTSDSWGDFSIIFISSQGVIPNPHSIAIMNPLGSYADAASFKAAMSGVMLYYELATPEDYTLDEPIPANAYVNDWGTEMNLPQGKDEDGQPLTTPLSADVVYGPNVVDAVKNLPKNYISKESMEAFLTVLGTEMGGTWAMAYDDETAKYGFTFTPNPAE